MSGPKKEQKGIDKDEVLQAVLIADDYNNVFSDFTSQRCSALLPIVGRCAIDYALEHLGRCGIQESIVFCSTSISEIRKHVENSYWSQPSSPMSVTVVTSERCRSLGDALRDIDRRAIIKGNFVLLSALSISNIKLTDVLKFHGEQCAKDKGTSMTLILQDVGTRSPRFAEYIYGINANTDRLLLQMKPTANSKVDVPLECLVSNQNIKLHGTLVDVGIAVCSPSVPVRFTDNFDFQTKDDYIKGVITNEEILDSRIYCYQMDSGYGATVSDWRSYQRVTTDVLHRWTFPLVPDRSFSGERGEEPFHQFRNGIYKQPGVHLSKSVNLEMDAAVGRGTSFADSSLVLRSVIGKNCRIGRNVEIRDSYIFDNCVIKDNCKIHLSVIGEGCVIKEHSKLKRCLLKRNVTVNEKSNLNETTLKGSNEGNKVGERTDAASEWDDYDEDELPFSLVDPDGEFVDDDDDLCQSSGSDSEESYAPSQEADDNALFYSEVVESLHCGFEDKVPCENLILEINSSRYAYNVLLKDVNSLTAKAIFTIPSRVGSATKPVLAHFLPLFKNYIKNAEAQMDCLNVIEELFETLDNDVTKIIHFLYDNDVLLEDVILKWHENLDDDSPVRPKVAPLIAWLEEAAEESSEEESE